MKKAKLTRSKRLKFSIFNSLFNSGKSSDGLKSNSQKTSGLENESESKIAYFNRAKKTNTPGDAKYYKVFKPKSGIDLQVKMHSNKTSDGWLVKSMGAFSKQINIQALTENQAFRNLNYQIVRLKIFDFINAFLARMAIVILVSGLAYLSFFDRVFLVKTYSFKFTSNSEYSSYLSEDEILKLTSHFKENKTFGLIPENQYWFLNQRNLTISAKSVIPEINKIEVSNRTWPNEIELTIDVEPILATLAVTENQQKKFWRISQNGRVLTEDIAGLRENLIYVETPTTLVNMGKNDNQKPTLQNSDKFQRDKQQFNRLWFALTIWTILEDEKYPVEVVKTTFPSLDDTNVIITTKNGTNLKFDSDITKIPRESVESRLRAVLNSNLYQREKLGQLSYIDFSIPTKKVFVCAKNKSCSD